jgi:FMN phosphatase YigB (HAD superfamily)
LGAKEAGLQTAWINPEGKLWADQSPQPWTVRNIAEVAQFLQV